METLRLMNKTLRIILIVFCALFLFRGSVFRTVVCYEKVGEREIVLLSDRVFEDIDLDVVIAGDLPNAVMDFVCDELEFSSVASNEISAVINSNKANCIGYSALYCALGEKCRKNSSEFSGFLFKHKIAHMHVFGINIHPYFSSPFFKDHDFVEVIDRRSGLSKCYDPSLADYLWIKEVTCKEEL